MDVSSILAISVLSSKSHPMELFLALRRESDNLENEEMFRCKSGPRSSLGFFSDKAEPRGLIGEVDESFNRAPVEFATSTPRSGGRTVGDLRTRLDFSVSEDRTIG